MLEHMFRIGPYRVPTASWHDEEQATCVAIVGFYEVKDVERLGLIEI